MIIGKIDYINLIPFLVYLKKNLRSSSAKAALNYHKGVPSKINRAFAKGRIEAAVISSIVSKKYRCSDFGIVAHKKVLSVLVCEGEQKIDSDSGTSNVLAKVLGTQGEVLIGDKALKQRKQKRCKDLATLWYERTGLPFVFARFCYRRHAKKYEKLADNFLKKRVKIPSFILRRYAARSGLTRKEILEYLDLIHYRIGHQEKKGLKKFLKLAKN